MTKQMLGMAVMLIVIFAALVVLYRAVPAPMDDIRVQDLRIGKGPVPKIGQTVTVNYTLADGQGEKMDSTYDTGKPFSFVLGGGGVVRGFDMAVRTMHVGGKRIATIPPGLGYGSNPPPGSRIPRDATLVFTIELLSAK